MKNSPNAQLKKKKDNLHMCVFIGVCFNDSARRLFGFLERSILAVRLKPLSPEMRETFVKYRNNREIVSARPGALFVFCSFAFISFETSFVFQLIVFPKVITTHLRPRLPSACPISLGVLPPWLLRGFSGRGFRVCSRSLREGSCCYYFCFSLVR